MISFAEHDYRRMVGATTPIPEIQDTEVWNQMLTPQVRALLGDVFESGKPQVMETTAGHFPGDFATNLNKHRLYDGESLDYVRFPYVSTMHKTEFGALVIKRDPVKLRVMGWVGDVVKGAAEPIYLVAFKDRRFDGTRRANDSALLFYPYDDPVGNRLLHETAQCVEISTYCFAPRSRIVAATGEPEFQAFIDNPFRFLQHPEVFRRYFQRAWETDHAPGQIAAPIGDVSKKCLPGLEQVAACHGYDFVECATSHYHVARWYMSRGYRCSYKQDEHTLQQFAGGIAHIRKELGLRGIELRRCQESWVAVVQSLRPEELIPDGLYLNGPLWPQDNIGQQNLWMNKPLHDAAASLIPGPKD